MRLSNIDFIKPECLVEELSAYHAHILGEWWLYEDGSIDFADSEVGDRGHEDLAVERLVRSVLDRFPQQANILNIEELKSMTDEDSKIEIIIEQIASHSISPYGIKQFIEPLYPVPLSIIQDDRWASAVLMQYEGAVRAISNGGTVYCDCFKLLPKQLHNIYELVYEELQSEDFDLSKVNLGMFIRISENNPVYRNGRMTLNNFLSNDYKIPEKFWRESI